MVPGNIFVELWIPNDYFNSREFMAESMHSQQKLRSGSLWVSASQCAPCSSGWVTQESQNVLGWNNTQRPRPWKWQVLDIQMLFSGQYNSQFCHLLAEYTWLIAAANLQLLLSSVFVKKVLKWWHFWQPCLLNCNLFPHWINSYFLKAEIETKCHLCGERRKKPLTIKLNSDAVANNQYPVN